ncbi:MAG: hypothetical protein KME60_33975 [Cyanomargarita calcarea GSE-NOS-MK-12-04C]|uniref:Uncharacterized protein n=1 Tax=Cyanomargarita calcarea GSE-NOS-MK-12-04C TaxID=2839659 RepID=A0A951QYH4_9CYAN|nr:hypothetical protein [Cyanomargarita calcarea GSE-NOS-MK-12-04C]
MALLIWEELVAVALVGTQRQTWRPKPLDNQLGELLNRLDTADVEGNLLSIAGAIALYQQAGKLIPIDKQRSLKSCDVDDLPECSRLAGQHLGIMLAGEYSELLPEWLALAAESGKRVPSKYLPELLKLGLLKSSLREAILPVLGKRGYWLAAQNPEWSYVGSENTEKVWETGSLDARKIFLKKLRKEDPNAALSKLQESWKKERAEERASLLQVLETGLSMNDEPFLESALDDKRKQVRDIAANLLSKLPSRLCQRMKERVKLLLAFKNDRVEVTLPNDCTQEMIRDGIDQSKYSSALGEKASLLLQMLSFVPPSFWCNSWDATPQQIIQAVEGSEWEKMLLEGFATAAVKSEDIAWAEILLTVCDRFSQSSLANGGQLIENLLKLIPQNRANALILQTLLQWPNQPLNSQHPAFLLLVHSRRSWDVAVSDVVLSSIRGYIEANNQMQWGVRVAWKNFARYLHFSVLDEAVEGLTGVLVEGSSWRDFVDEFLGIMKFRFEFIQALGGEK